MAKHDFGVNFEAYFLGPKGENYDFYEGLLKDALKDHVNWRRAFHSEDSIDFITREEKNREDFKISRRKIESVLLRLRELLKKNQPFFSPRYIGHMNWEAMAAPLIAFFSAALYNPNNVAKAGSTGTSELELQVGRDFLRLFGFDEQKGWGHICTGGTVANMEALWIARNMKVIPPVLKEILNEYKTIDTEFEIKGETIRLDALTDEVLLKRFNPEEILDLKDVVLERIKMVGNDAKEVDERFDELNMQEKGIILNGTGLDIGVVFMPETKHYSLKKAVDLLGMGRKCVRYVPVNSFYRMDMKRLREMVFKEAETHPILAVIGVAGSTEESSVDEIHELINIRQSLKNEKNMGFHIHVDAAYGGYVRSLFIDEQGHYMTKIQLDEKLKKLGIIGDKEERNYASWPHPGVFRAFAALPGVDTITIDPHKLGYILYPAGDSPFKFLESIGFSKEEWEKVKKVKIIRSVIMSPYLTPDYVDENYVETFIKYLREEIINHAKEILKIHWGIHLLDN